MIGQNIEVGSLWKYPVTGGPGVSLDEVNVVKGGIEGDRTLIVAEETTNGLVRLGSKQAPNLLGITYSADLAVAYLGSTDIELPQPGSSADEKADTFCDEFDDATPVVFTNPDLDEAFSRFLDKEVKLVRKTLGWQLGSPGTIRPRVRANAPLHFISIESVNIIAEMSGSSPDERRYKPGIVLRGMLTHQELDMVGQFLYIGDENRMREANDPLYRIDRGTPRCPVPSFDPETGENLGDISLRTMPKALNIKGKEARSAGVYGHLTNLAQARLAVGQIVTPPN